MYDLICNLILYILYMGKMSMVLSSRKQYFDNSENSSDCKNFSVICLRYLNSVLFVGCMHDLAVAAHPHIETEAHILNMERKRT